MSPSSPAAAPARSNLLTRFLTAVVATPLLLGLLFAGPADGWYALLFGATAIGAHELFAMTHPADRVARALGVLVTLATSATLYLAGGDARALLGLVVALPIVALLVALARLGDVPSAALRLAAFAFGPLWLSLLTLLAIVRRDGGGRGARWVLLAMFFAWGADTTAYFAGRFLGRHKLYEAVSPKKTVEGFVGALAGAVLGALLGHFWFLPELALGAGVALALVAGALGQLGDLGESLLKRSVGVKDSGGIVPGHGGILDRVDALMVAGAVVWVYLRVA